MTPTETAVLAACRALQARGEHPYTDLVLAELRTQGIAFTKSYIDSLRGRLVQAGHLTLPPRGPRRTKAGVFRPARPTEFDSRGGHAPAAPRPRLYVDRGPFTADIEAILRINRRLSKHAAAVRATREGAR